MCKLEAKSDLDKFVGYKLVAKDKETGKYYSLAMGFEYVEGEPIPVPEIQAQIAETYDNDILTSHCFSEEMVGRTAVFDNPERAKKHLGSLQYLKFNHYETRIMKAEISEDLMIGSYGMARVTAGRKIKFLEDVTNA